MKAATQRFPGYRETPGSAEHGTEPELRGKYGLVLPYDDEILSVFVLGARRFKKLAVHPGTLVFTVGDSEGTVHIPNALLDDAAEVIGAKRRRRLSDQQRTAAVERLRAYRYSGDKPHVNTPSGAGDASEGADGCLQS